MYDPDSQRYIPMKDARDLLVEFGEAFVCAVEFAREDDKRILALTAGTIFEQLTGRHLSSEDESAILPCRPGFSKYVDALARAPSQTGSMTSQSGALRDLLIEFGVSYACASALKQDLPHEANLQTSTRMLLELLTGKPALPEDVEDVFPYDQVLSDA